ncbi:MAG: formylmethanofuran dehydrogenase [Peptococcaceae bacterium]|nr:formylmethanofuran dehydrogenase [Peptococcaceae bacterium]
MQTSWEKSLEFHGHVCPGLVIGYRAAEIGLRELGIEFAGNDNLIAIAENDGCGIDAVQVVTGCTLGKGNLRLLDYGKQAYAFGRRDTGKAVRVIAKYGVLEGFTEFISLREKFLSGDLTEQEQKTFLRQREEVSEHLMEMAENELFVIQSLNLDLPGNVRTMRTVICSACGEGVVETKARVKDGTIVCCTCAGEAS